MDALKSLMPLIMQGSLILIVFAVGLQSHWNDLVTAVKRPALLLQGFVAVNLITPLVAVLVVLVLPIEYVVKIGIIVMAVSPLAPLVPGKMLKAGADTSYAVGVYVALILLAVAIVPLTFAILNAIFPGYIDVNATDIAKLVLTSVMVPLGAGLVIASLAPTFAHRFAPIANAVGSALLVVGLAAILYASGPLLLGLVGDGTVIAIIAIVAASLAAGHILGGPVPSHRIALALAAAIRHPGIAGLIAHKNFDDRRVMLAVFLFLLVSVPVSAIYQYWAMKRLSGVSSATRGTDDGI